MSRSLSSKYNIRLATIVFASQASVSFATATFLALAPFIVKEMNLTHSQIGLYSTSLYGGSLLAAVAGGWFVDRFQVRLSFTFGLGFIGILLCSLSVISAFGIMMLAVAVLGIAQSTIVPAVNKGIMGISGFDRMRATAIGLMTSAVSVGGLCSYAILPVLATRFGLRTAMLCSAAPALIMSMVSLTCYRDPPYDSEPVSGPARVNEVSKVLRDPYILFVGIVGLLLGGVQFCILTFFVLFLCEKLGISPLLGASTISIAQGAGILARPFWGGWSDFVLQGRRKNLLASILLLGGACCLWFSLLGSTSIGRPLLILIGMTIGTTIFGWPSIFSTMLSEYAGRGRTGIVSGVGLGFVRAGILTFPPLAGLIIDKTGSYVCIWLAASIGMISIGLISIVKMHDHSIKDAKTS